MKVMKPNDLLIRRDANEMIEVAVVTSVDKFIAMNVITSNPPGKYSSLWTIEELCTQEWEDFIPE